jgi:hypothetical protein
MKKEVSLMFLQEPATACCLNSDTIIPVYIYVLQVNPLASWTTINFLMIISADGFI